MDGLSSTASVTAVIQLTGSLVKLCGDYIQEVRNAREEILTLQRAITGLQDILQDLYSNLQMNHAKALPTSSRLLSEITACFSDLQALEAKLDPGKGKPTMRKMGLRSSRWPLERAEVEGLTKSLERYKSSFLLSLEVDQTSMMISMTENTDRINRHADLGKLEGAIDAGFESFSDRDEVECLPGTRAKLLREIMEWARSPSSKSIFWLQGMPGTGKSTISRTVARSAKDRVLLGASFFFKRGEADRGNAKKFFPTLTRQLMLWRPDLRSGVQKALDNDPDIASKSLREQFEKLLLQPLLGLDQGDQPPQNTVIVIDALDECEHAQDVQSIIRLLRRLQEVKSLCLRVFLTSRPELPISLRLLRIGIYVHQDLTLHAIPEETTEYDIELFLRHRFTKIRHDRKVPQGWPGDDIIQELVRVSVPLFISAATVCRYIEHPKWEPKSRLAELLKNQAKYVSQMDKIYLPILMQLLDDQETDKREQQQLLQEFQDTVGVIILLAVPLSINTLSSFLGIEVDRISNRLDPFRSVLSIPSDDDQPVRTLHLSFPEFLVQTTTKFRVDAPTKHKDIAMSCLRTMRRLLRRDICNLADPRARRAEIDSLDIHQYLPLELQYSCRYWTHHLENSHTSPSDIEEGRLFLQKYFLYWMEAMSLLGLISEMMDMLDILRTIVSNHNDNPSLAAFLRDAKRFVLKNRQIADEAPLQIYYAGLVFASQTPIIRAQFQSELPDRICRFPQVHDNWSAELQTLDGHTDTAQSVAFTPDGRLLASGSEDETIRLWDLATGALQQTLEGHTSWVYSVAFSPDGRLLASGSVDKTVRLWDPTTGALQQTLEGHTSWVYSVAFSPDGRLLASGSADKTVRLWDPTTGALQQTLEGHTSWVYSVDFSPDGRLLASGSADWTIKIWDTASGHCLQTLEGHSDSVNSVAFSYDSELLATVSADRTVKVWDTTNGYCVRELGKRRRSRADNGRSRDFPEAETQESHVLVRLEALEELPTYGQSLGRYKGTNAARSLHLGYKEGDSMESLSESSSENLNGQKNSVMPQFEYGRSSRIFPPVLPILVDMVLQNLPSFTSEPPVPLGKVRARWICRCGMRLFDDFVELEPGSVKGLEIQLQELGASSQSSRSPKEAIYDSSRAVWKFINSCFRKQHSSVSDKGNILPVQENGQQANTRHQSHPAPHHDSKGAMNKDTLLLLLCVDDGDSGTPLHQEYLDQVSTDYELFGFLRSKYFNYRSIRNWFTLRTIHQLSLSRFTVDFSNFTDVHKHDITCIPDNCVCLPPIGLLHKEYSCSPAPEKKPEHEPAIGSRRLTHYFLSPQCVEVTQKTVLAQLPKRIGPLKALNHKEVMGWGVHIQEGWHWRTIYFVVTVLVISFSLVFGIVWSITKGDVQSAFAISTYWLTLGSLLLGYIGVRST